MLDQLQSGRLLFQWRFGLRFQPRRRHRRLSAEGRVRQLLRELQEGARPEGGAGDARPRHEAEQPEAIGPGPGEAVLGLAGHPDDEALHGQHTAQQSQPAQSTGTQSGQSTTGSTAGITGDTAANADATATQTSKDAASRKNSDDNTADTAGGETTTTESGITDSGTDTAETTTQASPVTDRAETTSPVVRIVAGVLIALAVIGTLGAALIVRNKRRAPALAGANGGRSDDGFDIADGATPAPATTANAIAATEARADASAPTEVLQPIASPANGPSAGPSASLNVADSGGAPTARYDFNLVDGPSSR